MTTTGLLRAGCSEKNLAHGNYWQVLVAVLSSLLLITSFFTQEMQGKTTMRYPYPSTQPNSNLKSHYKQCQCGCGPARAFIVTGRSIKWYHHCRESYGGCRKQTCYLSLDKVGGKAKKKKKKKKAKTSKLGCLALSLFKRNYFSQNNFHIAETMEVTTQWNVRRLKQNTEEVSWRDVFLFYSLTDDREHSPLEQSTV